MSLDEILRIVDAQMKAKREREAKPRERRQQQVPVAVERRSGRDRRGAKRGS